jgi:nucleotide-binding universal stress UspA family protein
MSFKTILVSSDGTPGSTERIRFAADLAATQDAHLIGITDTGIARFLYENVAPELDLAGLGPLFAQLQDAARQRARDFDRVVRQTAATSFEFEISDTLAEPHFAEQALYADLAVLGQHDPDARGATAVTVRPEYVALTAPVAVLVVPSVGSFAADFKRILIGWNASPQAARAVRAALPLLTRAGQVDVLVCGQDFRTDTPVGGDDIALFLARHGVPVEVRREYAGGDVSDVLLSRASDMAADLLVIGCYGHSRLREILLGGVTRTVLRRMTVPTLMAH